MAGVNQKLKHMEERALKIEVHCNGNCQEKRSYENMERNFATH